eukprot:CAMPEP_0172709822 /NCGR_PEP_ID=MMETSP1074-20121228/55293_1 /TAXON_ID=2916 /ORGANISM="Ceratium fusus, Strain PA161109" /LENGTH=39 /DNA_ID= /DNA_START= /DNA_END= /DNA_ORIENTATION=
MTAEGHATMEPLQMFATSAAEHRMHLFDLKMQAIIWGLT